MTGDIFIALVAENLMSTEITYRESIFWKDRIRLLYNVILVDLDEDDILGSV